MSLTVLQHFTGVTSPGPATSLTVGNAATQPGSLLVLMTTVRAISTPAASVSGGGTWTSRATSPTPSNHAVMEAWDLAAAPAVGINAFVVSSTVSGSISYEFWEIAGAATSPFEAAVINSGASVSPTDSITTTNANDIVLGGILWSNATLTISGLPGAPWVNDATAEGLAPSFNTQINCGYNILSSASAQTYGGTLSSTGPWATIILAYQAATASASVLANIAGTWALYQVSSAAQLTAETSAFNACFANHPGMAGISVRVPANSFVSGGTYPFTGANAPTFDDSIWNEGLAIAQANNVGLSIRFIMGRYTPTNMLGNNMPITTGIPGAGSPFPVPWDVSAVANSYTNPSTFPPNAVFEAGYTAIMTHLVAWCLAHGVQELHSSQYSGPWAEVYLNTDLMSLNGSQGKGVYSLGNFELAHHRLMSLGLSICNEQLVLEYPFGGYGTNLTFNDFTSYIVNTYGAWYPWFIHQNNNLTDAGPAAGAGNLFHGRQTYNPIDYNWNYMFEGGNPAAPSWIGTVPSQDVTVELFVQSFNPTFAHYAQLAPNVAAFNNIVQQWDGSSPGPHIVSGGSTQLTITDQATSSETWPMRVTGPIAVSITDQATSSEVWALGVVPGTSIALSLSDEATSSEVWMIESSLTPIIYTFGSTVTGSEVRPIIGTVL